MKQDVWADDLLDRKSDAVFLADFIMRKSATIPKGADKGLVVNINSPWGGGKTFFVERFAQMLKAEGHRVGLVNAWRDDHAEDPMYAVMAAILSSLGSGKKIDAVRRKWSDTAKVVGAKAGLGAGKKLVSVFLGAEATDGIFDEVQQAVGAAVEEAVDEVSSAALRRFEEGQKAIAKFRNDLKAQVAKDKKPFVVLVDELDRCRPTYAIALLERIKHLFDVPNFVVVIATDTDQLCHTIRAVYGAGFAAERYLQRFFDDTFVLEQPSVRQLLYQRWGDLGLQDVTDVQVPGYKAPAQVAVVADFLGLSLRGTHRLVDLLWNVLGSRPERELKVPVPLIWVATMAAYFVLGRLDLLAYYVGEDDDPNGPNDRLTPREAAFVVDTVDEFRRPSEPSKVSLFDIVGAFRPITTNILDVPIAGRTFGYLYAEQYRRHEFSLMHRNISGSTGPRSVMADYGRRIRQAGKIRSIS